MKALALIATAALAQSSPQRVEAWREDIAVARQQFLAKDLSFSSAARTEADRRLALLERAVPKLSDVQIQARLAEAAALAGNAHTRVYLLRNRGVWRRYPLRIWRFADGWRVVAVRPGLQAILGAQLTAIGGRPVVDAERAVRPLFAGNDRWAGYMASYSLTSPDALQGVEHTRSDAAEFTFKTARGVLRRVLEPEPFTPRMSPEESWWFLAPAHEANEGWIQALAGRTAPLSLAAPDRSYGLRRCDGGALYVQYFRAQDASGESVAAFTRRVLEAVTHEAPSKLIIDLRFNTGGDLTKARPLFEALAKVPLSQQARRFFVILGPSTFSAGISPAASLRSETKAVIVGSEPGDDLEFWAEGGNVVLPRSGLAMHYADRAHTYSDHPSSVDPKLVAWNAEAHDLKPDLPADWRWADYAAGRDPQLEAALGPRARCAPIT